MKNDVYQRFWTPLGLPNRAEKSLCRGDYLRRLVGTPGFEPGTSCTPSKRATRLRYVPPSHRYHDLWRMVKISFKSLRIRTRVACAGSPNGRPSCFLGLLAVSSEVVPEWRAGFCNWLLAPAIVNPCSYSNRLISRINSISFLRYRRCPVFSLGGESAGNSFSQNRRT